MLEGICFGSDGLRRRSSFNILGVMRWGSVKLMPPWTTRWPIPATIVWPACFASQRIRKRPAARWLGAGIAWVLVFLALSLVVSLGLGRPMRSIFPERILVAGES